MSPAGRPSILVAATLLVALALLPGCGGGGGDETAAGPLTKSELIAEGDRICKQAREHFVDAAPPPPSSPEEAAALQRALIDENEEEVSRIRALDAPSELEPALDRYLKARAQGIELLKQGLEAAEDGDARAYAAAQRRVASGQLNRLDLAQQVGFEECSRPGGGSSSGG